MELFEIEELLKSTDRKSMTAVMRNAAILKNPDSTPEMKALALEKIKAIAGVKLPKSSPKPAQSKPKLEDAIANSEQKLSQINKDKIKANIATANNVKANNKAEVQADREKAKAEERKKQVLPGSEYTRQELQVAADRAQRDPKASPEKPLAQRTQTSAMAQKQAVAKRDSIIKRALDNAHQLHASGNTDDAHTILNAIPKEHMPKELKHYNPVYIHYGVTPELWKQAPHIHEGTHEFHNEVMSGAHDNHPDEQTRGIASKVKNILKPSVS